MHFAESGKKELKLSVWADDLILYVENPKKSTNKKKKTIQIREFSQVAGYKIKTQNPIISI